MPTPPPATPRPLPPMRVNTVTMVLVGIGVWGLALVALLVLQAGGKELRDGIHICLAGIGFGLAALVWAIPVQRRASRHEHD